MTNERLLPGHVLEFHVSGRFAYAQYLGRHPLLGDAIRLCPLLHDAAVAVSPNLFSDDSYVVFYPASIAVCRRIAEIVGTVANPAVPTRYRRAGALKDGRFLNWIVESDDGEVVKMQLTAEERGLPIAEIWNHEMLLQRLREHWRPELEY
jgi:hypothetical protein